MRLRSARSLASFTTKFITTAIATDSLARSRILKHTLKSPESFNRVSKSTHLFILYDRRITAMEFANFNQHIVLQPHNCLDSQAGSILQQQLAEIVPECHKLWVIDMTAVDFIDSSGLCALVGGLNAARHRGCRLVICNLSATVKLIFEITQLDQLFEIFDSFEQVISTETPALVA
ncbi:STAS domain-containing protein [Microcoleus sp. F10-C6]|uniref:STAS domain-containing protein n=2 Tax=unclassified Microcoleus TaxID=2642155 RepID=UPI002FD422A2